MPFIIAIVTMGPGFVLDAVLDPALRGLYISLAYTLPVLPPIKPAYTHPSISTYTSLSTNVLIESTYSMLFPLRPLIYS